MSHLTQHCALALTRIPDLTLFPWWYKATALSVLVAGDDPEIHTFITTILCRATFEVTACLTPKAF
jgi:hypothetical protein